MSTAPRRLAMTPRNVVRVAALTFLSLLGTSVMSGTAYAFWATTGTGTGTAAATTAQSLTTASASVASGLLYPGATGDVALTINNPNPFPVTVTTVTGTGTITSDKGAACDASPGVVFVDQTGLALAVPAASAQTFTVAGAVTMDNSSDNSCQGALFAIGVDLVGGSG